ncbi:MAG: MFS transporter [Thermoleophilaceae bacterium]
MRAAALGPRASITGVFFLNGLCFSAWYARVPAIQQQLELSPGELGIALFGAPAGLMVAQPIAGALAVRHGSRPLVAAAPLYLIAVVLPALAVDMVTLLLAVTAVGAANGVLDIAMNTQGVAVERTLEERLFSSLHAAFSFGGLAGAGSAAAVAAAGIDPLPHLAVDGAISAALAVVLARGLVRDEGTPEGPHFARPSRRLAALGVIAFCALMAEGSVFDWSGVYLSDEAGAAAGAAPLGLTAFLLTMGIGRLVGDRVAARIGAGTAVRGGALIAAVGLGLALAFPEPGPAIAGFAVMGVGLSVLFPLALRAAGMDGEGAGPALAAVSTVGYVGFLAGPPLVGSLADASSLRAALSLAGGLCVVAALAARRARLG